MIPTNFDQAIKTASPFYVFDENDTEYPGYWSDIRVRKETLPDGWNAYDIREGDGGDPATIEGSTVMVNYMGTFLTKETLPLPEREDGRKMAVFSEDAGWDYSFS